VATTGSDSNSCGSAQSSSTPKLTINAGAGCLSGGDTLIVKSGTYAENLLNVFPSGSAGSPTIIRSDTPLTAIIQPPGPSYGGTGVEIRGSYITFDGFTVYGINVNNTIVGLDGVSDHLIVQNCDVWSMAYVPLDNNGGAGININKDVSFSSVINNTVRDMPSSCDPDGLCAHGIYIHGNDNIIAHNHVHHALGYGIHQYQNPASGPGSSRNRIYNNTTHHNGRLGLLVGTGDDNLAYNNLSYSNTDHGIGVDNGGSNNQALNNTIYANGGYGIRVRNQVSAVIRNNILYQNGSTILDQGTATTSANNLVEVNPSFVNAGSADFHLQSGSAARGYGANLSSVFTTDYAGVSRPSVGSWDAGAYQYSSGGTPPPATQLVWYTQPANTRAGDTMPDVVVRIADASGLTVTTATNGITLTESTVGATITGTTTRAAVSGFATFSGLSFASTGTNLRFQAASIGLTSALSNTFTITTPGSSATQLVWGVQPLTTTVGATMNTVTVRVADVDGVTVPSATNSITLTESTTGATITGTATRAAVAGVGTFPGLSFGAVCSYCRFQATASGLTSALSNIFTITPSVPPGALAPPQAFRVTVP
jgi:hypothetical protein